MIVTPYQQYLKELKPKRRNKYGNIKTVVITDGQRIVYDSKREAKIAHDLRVREIAGEISQLKRQTTFKFELNGILICSYRPDFSYMENGKHIISDVKSTATAKDKVYIIKKKLMKAFFNIEILEIL